MRSASRLLATIAAVTAFSSQAQAASYDINLTAAVADISESTFDYGGEHYDRFALGLQGIDSSAGVTVANGDTINSVVTFDGAITIPASGTHTNLVQAFNGVNFTSGDTGVTGTFTLFNAGQQVASFDYGSTTSGQLTAYAALFPPNNVSLTFDSFRNNLTINTLDQPSTVQYSTFIYDVVSTAPVPEPGEWAMIAAGLGMIASAARRRGAARSRRS